MLQCFLCLLLQLCDLLGVCVSQGRNLSVGHVGWFPSQKVQPYVSVSTIYQPTETENAIKTLKKRTYIYSV